MATLHKKWADRRKAERAQIAHLWRIMSRGSVKQWRSRTPRPMPSKHDGVTRSVVVGLGLRLIFSALLEASQYRIEIVRVDRRPPSEEDLQRVLDTFLSEEEQTHVTCVRDEAGGVMYTFSISVLG